MHEHYPLLSEMEQQQVRRACAHFGACACACTCVGVSAENLRRIRGLNEIALGRGQSLAQMAVSWVLRDARVTSALIGASRPAQITELVAAVRNTAFTPEEIKSIDVFAEDGDINLWKKPSTDQRP